jgi:hypothetical protein
MTVVRSRPDVGQGMMPPDDFVAIVYNTLS